MKLRPLGNLFILAGVVTGWLCLGSQAAAQSLYQSTADFAKYASKLRENALGKLEPTVLIPTTASSTNVSGKYPWKTQIVTTVFWIGEPAGGNNPVHNFSSSWDLNWESSYGGYDNPNANARKDFVPIGFKPRQNPFYIALPYNDVTHGTTKLEARVVIPWFKEAFVKEGESVCRDRWVAIRNSAGKVCYAQWGDCGPFRTDHYQYVFGNEKPRPNLNGGAGLDVSPAVRDYLGLSSTDVTDWKFVNASDVPAGGPWAMYGENNALAQNSRRQQNMAINLPPPSAPTSSLRRTQTASLPTPTPAPLKPDAPNPVIIFRDKE